MVFGGPWFTNSCILLVGGRDSDSVHIMHTEGWYSIISGYYLWLCLSAVSLGGHSTTCQFLGGTVCEKTSRTMVTDPYQHLFQWRMFLIRCYVLWDFMLVGQALCYWLSQPNSYLEQRSIPDGPFGTEGAWLFFAEFDNLILTYYLKLSIILVPTFLQVVG